LQAIPIAQGFLVRTIRSILMTAVACIPGIEIQNGEITLIKWWIKPKEDGELYVTREELVGPKKLQSYFKNDE